MKKLIAFLPTWILFYTGDLFSRLPWKWSCNIYNWCMHMSIIIQDWAKLSKPWKRIN